MTYPDLILLVVGGALIGLSSGIWYLLSGRIAGISGLYNQVARLKNWGPPLSFLLGLIAAGSLGSLILARVALKLPSDLHLTLPGLVLGGLIVGIGTRWANGCTSGHGVCGLGRLSLRSFVAVPVFIAAAMFTVFVVHALGLKL